MEGRPAVSLEDVEGIARRTMRLEDAALIIDGKAVLALLVQSNETGVHSLLARLAGAVQESLGEEAMENGIRANIATFTRHHINVMMTKSKAAGNYVNSALAKTESLKLGFDEAIMLDPQGYVAECTGENIFLVRKGKIYTPPVATVLDGITRDALLTVARGLGYEVVEQPISRDMLYTADEVFVCGTAAEVVALSEIDFRKIGSGKTGSVARSLQKAFTAVVHGEDPNYESWLSYVADVQVPVALTQSAPVSAD